MHQHRIEGHIVICGWSETAKAIVLQIRQDRQGRQKHIVVIDQFAQSLPLEDPFLYLVKGDPTEYETLARAYLDSAETAIILTDWSINDPGLRDAKTALITLAIESYAPTVYTVAEVMRAESRRHLERAAVDEPICVGEISQRLLVHAAMNHGLSRFFTEILTFGEGSEIYKVPLPELMIGMNFRDVVRITSDRFQAIALAVDRDQQIHCNPGGDFELLAGDSLFVLAEEYPADLAAFGRDAAPNS